MSDLNGQKCTHCQEPTPRPGLWGLCTRCLYDESLLANEEIANGTGAMARTFGDYELVRPIGRGGMGVVYEAIQRSLGRRVALKMILDAEGASPVALRRFTLEAETVARLDHPNIVPLYQIGEVNGQPFLSMKLISGETLRKKLSKGTLGLHSKNEDLSREGMRSRQQGTAELIIKLAGAVEHAHDNGILHRDLKPGNILVDDSGQPHLLDFGLAKIVHQSSRTADLSEPSGAPGTPSYMSPEQAEGKRLSPASDIYGLGAVLYEMLCGVPPFTAATPIETLRKVIDLQPIHPRTINARIDKDIDTVCMKCLEKNPGSRYPSAKALAEDLHRWLRRESIRARPAGVPLRVTRWVIRNRLGAALIASLCLGFTVALLFLQQSLEGQRELDLRHANSLQVVNTLIEETWSFPEQRFIQITSSTRSDMANLPLRLNDPLNERLTVGNAINHEPFGQAVQYSAFLYELEQRMARRIGRPVSIDLNLYKSESDAFRDLRRGTLQFQRTSAASYVLAKQAMTGLKPLVRERSKKEAVIFATKNSAITSLQQIAGKRLVLGQPTSDCAFWGKVRLARAGITSSNLRSCTHMGGLAEEMGSEKKMADQDPNLQSYKRVVQEVLMGDADVGIAPRRQFELSKYRKGGLVELDSFPMSGEVFIASPELDANMAKALQESFLAFDSKENKEALLRLAGGSSSGGFEKISDEDFAPIRAALANEIARFEAGVESQTVTASLKE